jgi:thermostable 8-oxoguanine DNA glycosylase
MKKTKTISIWAIRRSSRTNSFLAWWELANIAKDAIRQSIEQDQNKASTESPTTERDNMEVYQSYGKRSLYFGRLWNGIQRYAVKGRQAMVAHMNPKRGAFKAKLKHAIEQDMANLSNEEVVAVLTDVRARYVNARIDTEAAWGTWVRAHASEIKRQRKIMRQRYEERNPEQAADADEVADPVALENLQNQEDAKAATNQEQLQEEVNQVTQQQIEEEVASALRMIGVDWKKLETERFKRSLKRQLTKDNLI